METTNLFDQYTPAPSDTVPPRLLPPIDAGDTPDVADPSALPDLWHAPGTLMVATGFRAAALEQRRGRGRRLRRMTERAQARQAQRAGRLAHHREGATLARAMAAAEARGRGGAR